MSNDQFPQTPSQTVGPFFHVGIGTDGGENVLVTDETQGEQILIRGRVLDGEGVGVPDALLEIWQADAGGRYNHPDDPRHAEADPHFRGFGRADTIDDGKFSIRTIKPGPVPFDGERMQAPHINVRVFSRGMLTHAYTRIYFSDEEAANAADPVLNLVDPERRHTLIARRHEQGGLPVYVFDIRLQGRDETVFFDP